MKFSFTDEQDMFRDTVRELSPTDAHPTQSVGAGTTTTVESPACGRRSPRWVCLRYWHPRPLAVSA